VSWLQKKRYIGRAKTDYSQFVDAEIIAKYSGVEWGDIDDLASKKDLEQGQKKAIHFIETHSPEVLSMPGERTLNNQTQRCNSLLGG